MYSVEINDELLDIAVGSAVYGGLYAEDKIESVSNERKSDNSFVTEADKQIESQIRENLETRTPFPVLGEEYGSDTPESDSYWAVDPIDGTQNYAYQQPLYATSVGLIMDNEPVIGVIYFPELEYLFYAKQGEGAYRNATPLKVQTTDKSYTDIYSSVTGLNSEQVYTPICNELNDWIQTFSCAVQSHSWTAAGWSDICITGRIYPWDLAAGVLLIREAGGTVQSIQGGSTDWNQLLTGGSIGGPEEFVEYSIDTLSKSTKQTLIKDTVQDV
jgi:myo-inositol-1(or 4)-monophosphatase